MSEQRAMQRLCGLMRKAVQDYEMLAPGDRVMVGLSGGKDSVALTVGLAMLRQYIGFYNKQCPCFAIGYDTPDNYCKRFYRGELEKKDTFSKRILTEEPKFVQKRKDTEK